MALRVFILDGWCHGTFIENIQRGANMLCRNSSYNMICRISSLNDSMSSISSIDFSCVGVANSSKIRHRKKSDNIKWDGNLQLFKIKWERCANYLKIIKNTKKKNAVFLPESVKTLQYQWKQHLWLYKRVEKLVSIDVIKSWNRALSNPFTM